ncbi:RING-H2 FINGER PROTEIN ATL40-LIKE [Salix purpurea]|uniref:RING-H2 FINGER PROTEIN ATL40-LIKE n=1 Tax=Salix purpurea TaxID=77065 RepID=A0A9Q0VAW3_SALPP|nr:RING-H2 FINGER PROTEIN ATL40-LIKE [Salix purpurea]
MGDNHPPFPFNFSNYQPTPNWGDNGLSSSNHGSNYDLNSKIMLTAILSLSFVVVVVIVLHIYARCALRRHQAHRRSVMNSLGLTNANTDGQAEDDLIECAVCLSMLEDQEMARSLPNCKHTFHAECIDKWLSSHSTCPICRAEAEPMIQPEPREGPAGGAAAAAPMLEPIMASTLVCDEGTSSSVGGNQPSPKVVGSGSRLSSFRRMLSCERSSRRIQHEVPDQEGFQDLERQ